MTNVGPNESRVRVRDGIYFCHSDGPYVFLDLTRDKYFLLDLDSSNRFKELAAASGIVSDETKALTDELLQCGILDSSINGDFGHETNSVSTSLKTLIDLDSPSEIAIRLPHVISFMLAYGRAWVLVRARSTQYLVDRVRGRRKSKQARIDHKRLRDLVSSFQYLATFFYSRQDQCFLDAVVLMEYLALNSIYATWVFAVTAHPFSAHCWVQLNEFLLNDRATKVMPFTPILAA